jgi:hypothetical protein
MQFKKKTLRVLTSNRPKSEILRIPKLSLGFSGADNQYIVLTCPIVNFSLSTFSIG